MPKRGKHRFISLFLTIEWRRCLNLQTISSCSHALSSKAVNNSRFFFLRQRTSCHLQIHPIRYSRLNKHFKSSDCMVIAQEGTIKNVESFEKRNAAKKNFSDDQQTTNQTKTMERSEDPRESVSIMRIDSSFVLIWGSAVPRDRFIGEMLRSGKKKKYGGRKKDASSLEKEEQMNNCCLRTSNNFLLSEIWKWGIFWLDLALGRDLPENMNVCLICIWVTVALFSDSFSLPEITTYLWNMGVLPWDKWRWKVEFLTLPLFPILFLNFFHQCFPICRKQQARPTRNAKA